MRLKDKVLQIVATSDGALVADRAIVRRVVLRAGVIRGYFDGREVVRLSGNVWQLVEG